MKSFKEYLRLVEAAGADWPTVYYHGTNTLAKANSIIAHGIQPGQPSAYKGGLKPTKGAAYLTADIYQTVDYVFGFTDAYQHDRPEPYGYLFTVDARSLGDFVLDEDAFVHFMDSYTNRQWHGEDQPVEYLYRAPSWGADNAAIQALWHRIVAVLPPEQMERLVYLPGFAGKAKIAKKLQKQIPREVQLALLANNPGIAHFGPVQPTAGWRFARADARQYRVLGPRCFEIGEPLKL